MAVATTAWAQATEHYPTVSHAERPSYPPIARAAHITGTVEIQIVVEKGVVADAQVKSVRIDSHNGAPLTDEVQKKVGQYLSIPSLANIRDWHFQPRDRATFVVTYVYRIEGKETAVSENPHVEIALPLVKVTARPVKPTVSH